MNKEIQHKILLNPGPGTTSEAVKMAQVVPDICPREQEFGNLMLDICQGLLKIGNGERDYEVGLFAASGTGAMEAAVTSALSKESKALIITNGAYGIRMTDICANYDLPFDTICEYGDYPEPSQIKQQLSQENYSHLIVIQHETSTGMMCPVEELADICQELGVKIMVDAMSTFGAYPIDLSKHKIDYLISSSNKGVQGMAGLSFVIFHKDCMDELQSNSRGFYFDIYKQWKNLQTKKQLRFTPPVQVCYAFKQAIDDTIKETVAKRWERYQSNWQILYSGLTELGLKPFLPLEQESKILLALSLGRFEP